MALTPSAFPRSSLAMQRPQSVPPAKRRSLPAQRPKSAKEIAALKYDAMGEEDRYDLEGGGDLLSVNYPESPYATLTTRLAAFCPASRLPKIILYDEDRYVTIAKFEGIAKRDKSCLMKVPSYLEVYNHALAMSATEKVLRDMARRKCRMGRKKIFLF